MHSNHYTVCLDACTLVPVLKRNLLLTLAKGKMFRAIWSEEILAETERGISRLFAEHGKPDPETAAKRQVHRIRMAFEQALVDGYDILDPSLQALPDQNDRHVVAAAVRGNAAAIITDNLKHFPAEVLDGFDIQVVSSDAFIADTIELDHRMASGLIFEMRQRLRNPPLSPEELIATVRARNMPETAGVLGEIIQFI